VRRGDGRLELEGTDDSLDLKFVKLWLRVQYDIDHGGCSRWPLQLHHLLLTNVLFMDDARDVLDDLPLQPFSLSSK
jgi:hypothetical protein